MSNSTKRALRTAFQVGLALLASIPDLAANLPQWAVLAQILVVSGGVSKAINAAEDLGVIPSWLKGDTPAVVAPDPAPAG